MMSQNDLFLSSSSAARCNDINFERESQRVRGTSGIGHFSLPLFFLRVDRKVVFIIVSLERSVVWTVTSWNCNYNRRMNECSGKGASPDDLKRPSCHSLSIKSSRAVITSEMVDELSSFRLNTEGRTLSSEVWRVENLFLISRSVGCCQDPIKGFRGLSWDKCQKCHLECLLWLIPLTLIYLASPTLEPMPPFWPFVNV